jgi:polar amino acid transport system permease protein
MLVNDEKAPVAATAGGGAPAGEVSPDVTRKHRPHVVTDVIAIAVVLIVALLVLQAVTNPNFGWPTIGQYFFDPRIMRGLGMTLLVTLISMIIAVVFGLIIANMRLSKNPILKFTSWVYVWFFRSVPTLVLLLLLFNISILIPRLVIGVPFGPALFAINTQELINGFIAGVAVFGFQQAAYTSEIIRSALLAIPPGQSEAAMAIGLRPWQRMRVVIIPQAFRIALPPIANDTINLMKSTSLLAFIAVSDLLYSVQQIYTQNYLIIPLLMVACFWYIILVSVLSVGQAMLENYLATGKVSLLRRPMVLKPARSKGN